MRGSQVRFLPCSPEFRKQTKAATRLPLLFPGSEAEHRSRGELQVVVGSILKVDLVADLTPDRKPTSTQFDAAAWIKNRMSVSIHHVLEAIYESCRGSPRGDAEIYKA